MGGATYPDDWGGWRQVAETRIVECIPEALASAGVEARIRAAGQSPRPCGDQGDSLPSPWTPC
jgi:hypothetical protein